MLHCKMDENFKIINMGKEIDLLAKYPKPNRDVFKRLKYKSKEDVEIARKFGKDFFDGDRKNGYGGFSYNPKYWGPVVDDYKKYWNLNSKSSLLDVGCAKGFMLYDLYKLVPEMKLRGIDISNYAISNAVPEMKKFVQTGDAKEIPFEDNCFDIVIAINTIHNLEKEDCAKALREISRVSKKYSFVVVDAYRNEDEKKKMYAWNLTGKTIMSVEEWKIFFKENNYEGDYFWFTP